MPAASEWMTSRLRSSLWIFRIISRRCLRFMSCHLSWFALGFAFLASWAPSCCLVFMLPSHVEFNLARPGRRKLLNLPSGVGPFLFQGMPATIYPIASTGAMLDIGQERSRENTALAAEPGCTADSNCASAYIGTIELSKKVSGSYNHPSGLTGGRCLTGIGLLMGGPWRFYNEFWEPRRQLWCLINSDSNRIALACPCIFRCRHIFFPLQILAHNTGSSIHEHRPLALICSCSCSRVRRCVVSVASLYIRFGVRSNGGLLLGGTWVALTFPNDVAISVCAAFASHLKSFWRETLLLTFATTLAGFCCAYFAKRRVNVR